MVALREELSGKEELIQSFESSDWALRRVPLAELNAFGQQRKGPNDQQEALTHSIGGEGLMHPISVALVSRDVVRQYLAYTNRTWGEARTEDQLIPLSNNPDFYLVLIAGHSRVESLRRLGEEKAEARFFEVNSVGDIVRKQLAENIHSRPTRDRAIRAIAEAFLWESAEREALRDEQRRSRPREKRIPDSPRKHSESNGGSGKRRSMMLSTT